MMLNIEIMNLEIGLGRSKIIMYLLLACSLDYVLFSIDFLPQLQKLKNKQSFSYRLHRFGPPLRLQMSADLVRRLQTFYL
ncbi:hypothetical protein Hanom_Chr02g00156861 [Helianthus anomalus]